MQFSQAAALSFADRVEPAIQRLMEAVTGGAMDMELDEDILVTSLRTCDVPAGLTKAQRKAEVLDPHADPRPVNRVP